MFIIDAKTKWKRGCVDCADHKVINGRMACPYEECPYHELDNVDCYSEYLHKKGVDKINIDDFV